MTPRKYAQDTSVPVGRSQDQIRELVLRKGATGWMVGEDGDLAVVTFRMLDRVLRFRLHLPEKDDARELRRMWRALHMAIKAKLVIAEEGIETFDEVFLANIVMPNGSTVGQQVMGDVQKAIKQNSGGVRLLLGSGA